MFKCIQYWMIFKVYIQNLSKSDDENQSVLDDYRYIHFWIFKINQNWMDMDDISHSIERDMQQSIPVVMAILFNIMQRCLQRL